MPPEAGIPHEWLHIARHELRFAQAPDSEEPWATRCFLLQQAAEKGLKAVLPHHGVDFPTTHNLAVLLSLIASDAPVPADIQEASLLTRYAVTTRYPRSYEAVTQEDYGRALRLAMAVVEWAEVVLAGEG
jgi:HEPN domain-containing protein